MTSCEHNWTPVGEDHQCFQCGELATRPCKNKNCISLKEQNKKMKQALMMLAEDRFATAHTKNMINGVLTSDSK